MLSLLLCTIFINHNTFLLKIIYLFKVSDLIRHHISFVFGINPFDTSFDTKSQYSVVVYSYKIILI